jgi:hypothetical protein
LAGLANPGAGLMLNTRILMDFVKQSRERGTTAGGTAQPQRDMTENLSRYTGNVFPAETKVTKKLYNSHLLGNKFWKWIFN